MSRGVCYVAYGYRAEAEASQAAASLLTWHSSWPVTVIDRDRFPQQDRGGRWAKLNLDRLSPFEQTLYLDADTRVRGDLSAGFDVLGDGYDLALVPSSRQGSDLLGNCPPKDRDATSAALGCRELLGLQAGVFFVAWNERTRALWAAWREEWERHRGMDQAALLRALHRCPVKVWLLGPAYNSIEGVLVEHRFGMARAA